MPTVKETPKQTIKRLRQTLRYTKESLRSSRARENFWRNKVDDMAAKVLSGGRS